VTTLIDIGFAKGGGSWADCRQPRCFSGGEGFAAAYSEFERADVSLVKNAQGQSSSVTTPDFAFQQLTDNREWNWAWCITGSSSCRAAWMADRAATMIEGDVGSGLGDEVD